MALPESPRSLTDGLQEKCGITAVFGKQGQDTAPIAVKYQDELRHRGRDAAGIAVFNKDTQEIALHKGPGRALLAFKGVDFVSEGLVGERTISHGRYATSGAENKDDETGMQPVIESYNGRSIAIAFNGNLPNIMRQRLREKVPFDMPQPPDIDTYDIAQAIVTAPGEEWEEKFKAALDDIPLAYSLTMLTDDGRVFGLRCPAGTWPLWIGQTEDQITFSSESRVDLSQDVSWESVRPGELVEATSEGVKKTQLFEFGEKRCSLNDGYFARGDSLIFDSTYAPEHQEGVKYEEFRQQLGRQLAQEYPIEADIYIGVPETGLSYVKGYVDSLDKKQTEYIKKIEEDKTFISPSKEETLNRIERKFMIPNPELPMDVLDTVRSAVVIDDSIVKGNTMGGDPERGIDGIVQKLRKAGIQEIHLLSGLPKFTRPCDQGVFIPTDDLVAIRKSPTGEYEEVENRDIAERMGADSVNYLSKEGYKAVNEHFTGKRDIACMGCFGEPHPLENILSEKPTERIQPIVLYPNVESVLAAQCTANKTAAD